MVNTTRSLCMPDVKYRVEGNKKHPQMFSHFFCLKMSANTLYNATGPKKPIKLKNRLFI